jgi:hypothetical protein
MENLELKEKLLCALRNNIEDIKPVFHWNSVGLGDGYKLGDIVLYVDSKPFTRTKERMYFWQSKTETIYKDIYRIDYGLEKVEITKEEYEEIINLRQEKIKEKQLEELDKLCKNN